MGTFVLIEPDAFNQSFNKYTKNVKGNRSFIDSESGAPSGIYHHVRRPVRGIQVKDDTYGTLQVRRANGTSIQLFDAADKSNTGKGIRNSNFLIQSVTEQRAEKQQIILTFGEPYIFFFGEQPRMINVSGILLNTEDFNWRAEWWANYDSYLRGTQCVRQKTRVYLSWDDIIVEGYVTQANAAEDASNRNLVQFSFAMFLTNYQNISTIGEGADKAHFAGKEINLDPSTLDLPGNSSSTTVLVRSQNVLQQELEQGKGSSSLLEYLRNGEIQRATSRLVEVQGQVVDVLSLAGKFISGRNIRVPRGFEGSAAFDQDAQIALASVPGALDIINGSSSDRVVRLQFVNSNLVTEFTASLGSKFISARTGLPLSANEDEFIARQQTDESGAEKFGPFLFSGQLAKDIDAASRIEDVFEQFGIKIEATDEIKTFFKKAMFGIAAIAAGMFVQDSSKLRSVITYSGVPL